MDSLWIINESFFIQGRFMDNYFITNYEWIINDYIFAHVALPVVKIGFNDYPSKKKKTINRIALFVLVIFQLSICFPAGNVNGLHFGRNGEDVR